MKKHQPLSLMILLFLSIPLMLAGCGSEPPQEPPKAKEEPKVPDTVIKASIVIANDVNPDINGRPSPVAVRVYELKSIGKFEEADFFKLLEDHEGALGSELLVSEKFHFKPGDSKELAHAVSPETKFFAVTAAFRDFSHSVWRAYKPIEAAKTNELIIEVNSLNTAITSKQAK